MGRTTGLVESVSGVGGRRIVRLLTVRTKEDSSARLISSSNVGVDRASEVVRKADGKIGSLALCRTTTDETTPVLRGVSTNKVDWLGGVDSVLSRNDSVLVSTRSGLHIARTSAGFDPNFLA